MSNIADIVKGINQAAANAFDGAIDEEGEPRRPCLPLYLTRPKFLVGP